MGIILILLANIPHRATLSLSQVQELGAMISNQEIISALQDITERKSSSHDVFNSQFFLHCWNTIKTQFLRAVHFFFIHSKMLALFKHSLIIFIPKVKYSLKVNDFRYISLCNMFY